MCRAAASIANSVPQKAAIIPPAKLSAKWAIIRFSLSARLVAESAMRLFQRIFATFCMVIICAIFVASFSFWVVQNRLAESQFKQTRNMEISLLGNAQTALQGHGEQAVRELLERWRHNPAAQNVIVITGDDKRDILNRRIQPDEIERAYGFAIKNPNSNLAAIIYDPFGEEYLFFVRHFDRMQIERMPSPLLIPGLGLAPIWHEFIILASTLIIGLLLAYILANNITKPIRILEQGMNRFAAGDLDTRVSRQLHERKDELANLGVQFDKMVPTNCKSWWKKNAICCTTFRMKCVRLWRGFRRFWG
uniref:histidine kinase n=1 Tax=Conchiformibius kuhniae TaxID=211502 RepID=A0A8T9MXZ2_9NEIS|nr:HAMP domain-containing protein [Conchiformibius kuhniae]